TGGVLGLWLKTFALGCPEAVRIFPAGEQVLVRQCLCGSEALLRVHPGRDPSSHPPRFGCARASVSAEQSLRDTPTAHRVLPGARNRRLHTRKTYWIELAAAENALLALEPTSLIVPTT